MYGIIIAALIGGFATGVYQQNRYEGIIEQIRAEHQALVDEAREDARIETNRRKEAVIQLEVSNAKNNFDINDLRRQLDNIRLRDPGTSSRCVSGDGDTTDAKKTAPGTELSEEFDGFLKSEALRADKAATYANLCYNWINSISP